MENDGSYPIRYADLDTVVIDETKVPAKLLHLVKYAKQWSIGDDLIRSQVMDQTPLEELKTFVDAVDPMIDEIYEWVYQVENDPNFDDERFIFQSIAEPCAEARMRIGSDQRRSSGDSRTNDM